ncbi:hypothetical protein AAG906_022309 [Vitis piasezkii]
MQMVVAHGGRCAERVVDDLEKITKIVREMVISPKKFKVGVYRFDKTSGLIKYMVYSTFIPCLSFSPSCLVDYFLHISLLLTHYITFSILVR